MIFSRPPKKFLIDSFDYEEYVDTNDWNAKTFKKAITIEHCRIERESKYSSDTSGSRLIYDCKLFCYNDLTKPLPKFKKESKVMFDGQEYTIVKVIENYEPFQKIIYSYELEVI